MSKKKPSLLPHWSWLSKTKYIFVATLVVALTIGLGVALFKLGFTKPVLAVAAACALYGLCAGGASFARWLAVEPPMLPAASVHRPAHEHPEDIPTVDGMAIDDIMAEMHQSPRPVTSRHQS